MSDDLVSRLHRVVSMSMWDDERNLYRECALALTAKDAEIAELRRQCSELIKRIPPGRAVRSALQESLEYEQSKNERLQAEVERLGQQLTARRYVYQCSNPSCGQIWEADPHGHCPACLQPDGTGWSCITIAPKLYHNCLGVHYYLAPGRDAMDGAAEALAGAQQGAGEEGK